MVKDRIIARGGRYAIVVAVTLSVPGGGAHAGPPPPTRYASPGGIATGSCPVSAPCEIAFATHNAPTGSEVVIEPGNYGSVASPLNENIGDGGGRLDIHGETGHPRPVIYLSYPSGLSITASALSYVTIHATGLTALDLSGGTATRVLATDSADNAATCGLAPYGNKSNPALSDSVCIATGSHSVAVEDEATVFFHEGTTHATVENVTARATGAGGLGLWDSAAVSGAGSTVQLLVKATNDIFYGTRYGVLAESNTDGSAATVILRNSIANSWRALGRADAEVDTETPGDSHATPRFVDAAHLDFRERPGSPTIDNGVVIKGAPTKDFAGNPRTVHRLPDSGANEHLVRPVLTGLTTTPAGPKSVKIAVQVNGEGIPTGLEAKITRNGHLVEAVKNPHSINGFATAHFVVHSLKPGRTYQVRVVGQSLGGQSKTKFKPVTTES